MWRFLFLVILHCINLILFAVSTTPVDPNDTKIIIYIQITLSAFFLSIELRQMIYYASTYFLSIYNYLDVAANGLVLLSSLDLLDLLSGVEHMELRSFTILLLWLRLVSSC